MRETVKSTCEYMYTRRWLTCVDILLTFPSSLRTSTSLTTNLLNLTDISGHEDLRAGRHRLNMPLEFSDRARVWNSSGWKQNAPLTPEDWVIHRPFVEELYINEQKTLDDVMRIMKETLGFVATLVFLLQLPYVRAAMC